MKKEPIQVLVVDDEPNMRKVLRVLLEHDGYEVHTAQDGLVALSLLSENHIDIVISDLKMPRLDGMALLRRIVEDHEGLPVIILTAHGTVDTAVEAVKLGAFDYVTKPFDRKEMRQIVAKAARTQELARVDASVDRDSTTGRYSIIGRSQPMRQVFEILDRVADTPSTVLITGESGTGKELVARALHENSGRRGNPYIRVNCAAIPPGLIESELFGYEKGAFTGADTAKPGRFELAHNGTLFLDEIGEISLEMQVKLLRALQEGEFERVGGISTTKVDVRLVTATNQDLRRRISEGLFREDLFYRLNVVNIHLPALRERPGDIELLVEHFLSKYNIRLNKKVQLVSAAALELLQRHCWPGNIRELENVIERCVLFCDTEAVQPPDLPPDLYGHPRSEPPFRETGEIPLHTGDSVERGLKGQIKAATANLERQLINRALDQTGRNVTRAARLLKISRKSLQTKMKDLGLREEGGVEIKG
ncbi:MAG: sigma-54 dependent transcriptional regulator [Myxococcota bacterium]|jgi:DNA-binding NtrC family response regulator|nr:sigma-54 dependent transcriptional regulator [Myxococcota bacterium]